MLPPAEKFCTFFLKVLSFCYVWFSTTYKLIQNIAPAKNYLKQNAELASLLSYICSPILKKKIVMIKNLVNNFIARSKINRVIGNTYILPSTSAHVHTYNIHLYICYFCKSTLLKFTIVSILILHSKYTYYLKHHMSQSPTH